MKKHRILISIIAVILALTIIVIFSFTYNRVSTFDKVVNSSFDLKTVSSIEIIKRDSTGEQTVNIADTDQIEKLLTVFSDLKIQKSSFSDIEFKNVYWITLKGSDQQREVGITMYDNAYMNLYIADSKVAKNKYTSYKVKSNLNDDIINDLFK